MKNDHTADSRDTAPEPVRLGAGARCREGSVAEQNARKLVVIDFDDALRAQEFLLAATRLVKEGQLTLHDAVFVSRGADGRSMVRETTDLTPAAVPSAARCGGC
ncbi:hypothetical protein Athai_51800 [Actinocatenispora thailandica]|uniref:Uncharacterized protein n=1 Tax=Actinocatenispora thailandica TaxID=227318 RepID=A0A7R7DTS1_9ACTN|nr:hypothetical protein Athai_51800 [Actinocatenispora thailandica]